MLDNLRHQIFHFVSTLQQYVQSQLSHVSWCRFLESLKHKVKDLTDLDLVHMDYLVDSQHMTNIVEQELLPNVSGGGRWESLLDGTGNKNDIHPGDYKTGVTEVIKIPLDFVLEKCLLEEIQLKYMYVSKLTIKLLEEGFSLQQHLLGLRRYHMKESADWADLFIVSLWQHKRYATEADKRISEIQGLLELSVQRSSCEKDHHKDRLFVYMKEQDPSSLPSFSTGIFIQVYGHSTV